MNQLLKPIHDTPQILRRIGRGTIGMTALLLAAHYSFAQTLLIDLGPNDGANGNITTSPDVNGNYWNNITNGANGSSITNLVTTNNVLTTVALTVSSNSFAGNGIQNGGLLNPNPALLGIFAIATATEDYFYINQTYGTAAGTSGLLISGLNPLLAYNLSMFATRNTATARVTTYSVTDVNGTHSTNLTVSGSAANSGSNSSDTQGNDETIVSLSGLVPNAAGQLTLDVAVGNSQNYAYLGILMISQSPSKPAFAVNPVTQTDRVGTTNTLTASAVGTLPITYQWYFAGSNAPGSYNAVSGATGTNLVLANVGYGNGGNYYCVASNSLGTTTSAVAAVSIVSLHVPAQSILIDFGPDGVSNTDGAPTSSPDGNGNYWNNMDETANGTVITNLVTANDAASTVSVTLTSSTWANNGITHGGLLSPNAALLGDFAIATVTEDYFYIQNTGTTGTFEISGLNPALAYNLSMFATRTTSATDTRNSIYSVTDVNGTHSVTLQTSGPGSGSAANPYGNDQTIVSLNGLVPNTSGQLNFTASIGANTGSAYAYVGALEIASIPAAPTFAVNPVTQTDRVGTTNTLTASAVGTLPITYQWYFAGSNAPGSYNAVSGATGTNLVLANVGYGNGGNYYCVASNSLGTTTSAVAAVSIVSLHVPAQSILIDFGPDGVSNTDGAPTSSPDGNGNYWNNMDETANGTVLTNLVTANDAASTVSVTLTSSTWANNGITHGGLLSPNAALLGDFAIATVTEDYFYIQNTGTTGTFEISGLNPALAYNLSMFATRTTSATDTRNSIYSVTDVNGTHSVTLQTSGPGSGSAANPYGNDQTIVSLNGLVPNTSGQLNFTASIGANTGSAYAYVGALEIAYTGPAPQFTVNPQSQTNGVGATVTLNALATNTLPISYQWYFANSNAPSSYNVLSGATGTNLVLANLGSTNAGNYYCVASNSLGTATSAVATVTVTNYPPVASFSATPTSGGAPLLVAFSDASSGLITNWFWNFGDGNTANTTTGSVSHTYAPGSYSATEIVSGPGGSSTNIISNYINVTKTAPVVSWSNPANITYGAPLSGTQLNASCGVTGSFVYTPRSGTVLGAGSGQTLSVTFTPADTTDYATVTKTVSVSVNQAGLVVAAQSEIITYGASVPASTVNYSGFVNGDTAASLTAQPSITSAQNGVAAAGTYVGNYTVSGAASPNYNISYTSGNLTVNALTVILTGSRNYDGTVVATNSILSVSNAVGSDVVTLASGSAQINSSDIGTNAITNIDTLVLGGPAATNYSLTGASGAVIVTALPVALSGSRDYDTTATAVYAILSITNAAGADDVSLASGGATLAAATAGAESIVDPSGLTLGGTTASNYTLVGAGGTVTINPVTLSITAQPQTITYGSTVPATTIDYNGFVGTESPASLTTVPSINSTQTGVPAAGTYSGNYTVSGAVDPNYTISYVPGDLVVNPLTVVLSGNRPYDGTATVAASFLSVANAVGSDLVILSSGSATLAGSSVGTQVIVSVGTLTLGGAAAGNYSLAGATGAVTISNPGPLFLITSAALDSTMTNLVVCWQSVPGVTYNVLTNTSVNQSGVWVDIGGAISPVTAVGTSTCVTIPGATNTQAFVLIKQN